MFAIFRRSTRRTIGCSLVLVFSLATSITGLTQELDPNDYERLCTLKKGELLKRIAPPFAASRDAWYYEKHEAEAIRLRSVPTSMVFRSHMGANTRQAWSAGGNGMRLSMLLRTVANAHPHEITGDRKLLDTSIPGDFVFASNASQEQIVKRLGTILKGELGMNIQINQARTEQEVYIVRGQFKPSATEKKPRRIEGSGQFPDFIHSLAAWIEHPVISEVAEPLAAEIQWYAQLEDVHAIERDRGADNVDRLLEHITRQTGFSFAKDKREMPVLRVEQSKE